jgi:Tol biopolymer transport system component
MKRFTIIVSAITLASFVLLIAAPAVATTRGKNGRIAFRRYLNDDHTYGAIFSVNPDGSGERQMTHPRRDFVDTEPDWSPNGRWLVYAANPENDEDHARILKIRANGRHRTSLDQTCTDNCQSDSYPAWSPNGRMIAFERLFSPSDPNDFNGLIAIYIMRADGTDAVRVTRLGETADDPNRFRDHAPTWSPGGDRLAFARYSISRRSSALFTVALDGTKERRITPWRLDGAQPDWSPDGHWIVFRTQERSERDGDIFLVHPSGEGLHRAVGGRGKWLSCSFSPKGNKIQAGHFPGSGEDGAADVYVFDLDGSHLRNVTDSGTWESASDWGPRPD